MKHSMKRIMSMTLALIMAFSMLATVFAVDSAALSYSGSASYKSGKYYTNLTKVNLTGNQRNDIVAVAESQIGYREGNNSSQISGTYNGTGDYTEYGRWYGLQSLWCAMFVSWAAAVAGVSTSVVPKHSYTVSGLNFFKNQGRAYSRAQVAAGQYTPQRGDIVYFKYSRNSNPTNHVGIVTGYSNGTLHTVEGNTSSSTYSSNGGVVAPHTYSISNTAIVYICKPAYSGSGSGSSTTVQSNTVTIPAHFKNWVFDATYYADNNPDLKAAFGYDEAKLYKHFCEGGVYEGRAGSALFDVKHYLNQNADIKKAFGKDYVAAFNHFIGGGSRELDRKFSATLDSIRGLIFNARVYFSRHEDLQKAFGFHEGALFEHFMTCGLPEGRTASPYFDINWYVNKNSDLKKAFGTNYWAGFKHFLTSGQESQHKASAVVDTLYYVANNPDLKGYSTMAAVRHYKEYGAKEGRRASAEFNAAFYYANNPDIHSIYTLETACVHYVEAGIREGRAGSDDKLLSGTCSYLGANFKAKISFATAGKNLTVLDQGGTVSVVTADPSSAAAQNWNFIRQSDGSYKIKNMKNGYLLTIAVGTAAASTVTLESDKNSSSQRWFVYKYKDGYVIRPASASDVVLDVASASTENNAKIQGYRVNYTAAQCFTITKTR